MSFAVELLQRGLDLWGASLLRAGVQGGLAALVVTSLCRLVPAIPARFQCWLWRLVVVKFLVALFVAVPVPLPFDLPLDFSHPSPLRSASESHAVSPMTAADSATNPAAALSSDAAALAHSASAPLSASLLPTLFLVWAVLAAWQIARIAAACRNAQLLRRRCRVSDDRRLFEPLVRYSRSAGLVRPPEVLESEGEGSPLVVGILHPAIVLPTTTLARLTGSERALVLGHELAHIGRRDLVFSLVASIVRALFFFHPLAWLSRRRLELAQEIAADELAITMQNQSPIDYASLLLSVVGKLGPARSDRARTMPMMSVGAADNRLALEHRLSAMRYFGGSSIRLSLAAGLLVALGTVFTAVPWTLTAAAANAVEETKPTANRGTDPKRSEKQPDRTPKSEAATFDAPKAKPAAAKSKAYRGRFVAFDDRMLTIETNTLERIATPIPEDFTAAVWNNATDKFERSERGAALKQLSVGKMVAVNVAESGHVTLRIGSRKGRTIGTFVSYKEDRLQILGTNLAGRYTKKYGNSVHFNRFRPDVPAFERIDDGEYRPIGLAKDVLAQTKEGTLVTVHGEGDDNITRVEIGAPKAE